MDGAAGRRGARKRVALARRRGHARRVGHSMEAELALATVRIRSVAILTLVPRIATSRLGARLELARRLASPRAITVTRRVPVVKSALFMVVKLVMATLPTMDSAIPSLAHTIAR